MPDALIVVDTTNSRGLVIGEHRYSRTGIDSLAGNSQAFQTGSWTLEIDLYPEIEEILKQNGWVLEEFVEMTDIRGLPVFDLEAPLRLADDNEVPAFVEVQYGRFAVRRGCDRGRALTCSDDERLQVVVSQPSDEPDTAVTIELR